jgi:hypothetical protein
MRTHSKGPYSTNFEHDMKPEVTSRDAEYAHYGVEE